MTTAAKLALETIRGLLRPLEVVEREWLQAQLLTDKEIIDLFESARAEVNSLKAEAIGYTAYSEQLLEKACSEIETLRTQLAEWKAHNDQRMEAVYEVRKMVGATPDETLQESVKYVRDLLVDFLVACRQPELDKNRIERLCSIVNDIVVRPA